MAKHLDVSTWGFYDWRKRRTRPSRRAVADSRLTEAIGAIHTRSRGAYGSPRIWAELRHGMGIRVGRKRVERLMRLVGIADNYPPPAAAVVASGETRVRPKPRKLPPPTSGMTQPKASAKPGEP